MEDRRRGAQLGAHDVRISRVYFCGREARSKGILVERYRGKRVFNVRFIRDASEHGSRLMSPIRVQPGRMLIGLNGLVGVDAAYRKGSFVGIALEP